MRSAAPPLLAGLVLATAALSPLLGIPVSGHLLGRDTDFTLASFAFFDAQIAQGILWPRWLPGTNHGLGGPTFYLYPPLSYWVAALLRRALGLRAAEALAVAMAAWRLALLGTAWVWLRRHRPPSDALVGAALAVLLPYLALVNPWYRFAYAETAALALLPPLLIGIEAAADGRRGLPAVAVGFAALALTHMPSCVLAAHLGLLYAWGVGGGRAVARLALGGLAGAGLAACFLLPVLGLRGATNEAAMDLANAWRFDLLFFTPLGDDRSFVLTRLLIWGSAGLALALGLALTLGPAPTWAKLPGVEQAWRRPGPWRGALALLLGSFGLTTVLALPLWLTLPQLAAVQFPWRAAGPLCLAAALPLTRLRGGPALGLGVALALLPAAFLLAIDRLSHPDWPRFLPAEARLERALADPGAYPFEHWPKAAAAWQAGLLTGETLPRPPLPPGAERRPVGFRVSEATAPFLLPQFYFPSWSAWDAAGTVPVRADPRGLLEVVVNRPVRDLHVEVVATAWERIGWAITGLTAAGLLGLGWRARAGRSAG